MNSVFNKLKSVVMRGGKKKNMLISVVILVEIILLLVVATYAWVETVSSIKITNEANTIGQIIDDTKYTDMLIGGENDTIDLLDYFEPSGDMHLAPASSADGKTFYFPKANITSNFIYRKGNVSDKNTTYLSASFKLRADTNADFFFTATPAISVSDDIRVSVTAYTEGDNPEGEFDPVSGKLISNTKIYANNASTTAVVNSTTGDTGATTVEKFTDHQKGKNSTARLFAVGANETKYVTINVWLQKKTANNNDDLTQNMSVSQAINYLGITSSLTPRHVTLIPTPTWDISGTTQYFYAWCWGATNGDASRLYKLELDDNEHYGFDYNGTYQNTLFLRSGNANLTKEYLEAGHWNDNTVWDKTEDTSIPNDPVDPTFIIETINGSSEDDDSNKNNINDWDSNPGNHPKKSTGSWHDPAIIKLALCTGQDGDSPWGSLSATTYIGTTTSTHVMEQTNSDSNKHKDTVHAWPGKKIKITAVPTPSDNGDPSNYAFVGWYDNPEGIVDNDSGKHLLSSNATYEPNAPAAATDITYYAKFKEVRTLNIVKYLDGNSTLVACGTITINNSNTATATVDKGSNVTFSATAATGYTLHGIYTASSGGTLKYGPNDGDGNPVPSNYPEAASIEINNNTTYYARFTTNTHTVNLNTIGSTGSTVQYGSETAATSVEKTGVKYNSSVTINANPANGYKFVGWYTNSSGTGTAASTNASYTFTMGDADVIYYAKFEAKNSYYLKASWNGWSESQAHLTGSGNEITYVQELDPGEYTFKIFDGDDNLHWSNAYTYKYKHSSGTYLGADGGDTLNSSDETGNMVLNVGYTAKFTFHFNRSTNKFWITASDVTTYHVVGDITGGWAIGNNNKMSRVGNTNEYVYTVYVDGYKSFKILTNSGTWYSNGYDFHDNYYGGTGVTFNTTSGDCSMNGSKKNYVFHYNSSNKKFWITDP